MFATYEEFKDALQNFHPQKIGYTYCKLSNGWIDKENFPTYRFLENNGIWVLWIVKDNLESEAGRVDQNDPLETRNLLCMLEIITLADYWQELCDDSGSF